MRASRCSRRSRSAPAVRWYKEIGHVGLYHLRHRETAADRHPGLRRARPAVAQAS
jgi:hypothetical protein